MAPVKESGLTHQYTGLFRKQGTKQRGESGSARKRVSGGVGEVKIGPFLLEWGRGTCSCSNEEVHEGGGGGGGEVGRALRIKEI